MSEKGDAKQTYSVERIETQSRDFNYEVGKVQVFHRRDSPWLEVETPEGALAIWISTGAIHPVTTIGAVTDEPLDLPFPAEWPDLERLGNQELGAAIVRETQELETREEHGLRTNATQEYLERLTAEFQARLERGDWNIDSPS